MKRNKSQHVYDVVFIISYQVNDEAVNHSSASQTWHSPLPSEGLFVEIFVMIPTL